jgi:hypothetical protein
MGGLDSSSNETIVEIRVREGLTDDPVPATSFLTTGILLGYGARWSVFFIPHSGWTKDKFKVKFRGFVEPMMENGHEIGWRH